MERGLHQGDSLVPYLFNITLLPLIFNIKKNIYDIQLNQVSLKAIVYADDALWIAQNRQEIQFITATIQ